jgi:hypothetical protein
LAGPFLALVEGEELVLVLGINHQVKSGGVGEEALAEFLVAGSRRGGSIVHDGYSGASVPGQK